MRKQSDIVKHFLLACLCLALMGIAEGHAQTSLRVVLPAMPAEFDPQKTKSAVDLAIASELFMGLVARDSQGTLVPGLAESWEISPDGLIYTFSLRSGIRWSDDRRIRARDFVAGLQRALDPDTGAPFAGDLFAIQGAEGVNSGEIPADELSVTTRSFGRVEITLRRPSDRFLEVLSRPVAVPIPTHAADEDVWMMPGNMVTTGAFIGVVEDSEFALQKNPHFFDSDSVALDRIDFVVAKDAENASATIIEGDADISLGFPFSLGYGEPLATERQDTGENLYFVAANVRRPLLSERNMRHALAMTINREVIVRESEAVDVMAAYKVVPPSVLDETLSPRSPYAALRGDMREPIAEVLLSELKVDEKNPQSMTLVYPPGRIHELVSKKLVETWAPINVSVTAEEKSTTEYDRSLASGDYDLALGYWPRESAKANGYLEYFASSAGPRNITGYADPDFDKSLEAADSVLDEVMRPPFIASVENILIQDQTIFPIFYFKPRRAVATRVQGWDANAYGIHPFRYLSVQNGEQSSPAQ